MRDNRRMYQDHSTRKPENLIGRKVLKKFFFFAMVLIFSGSLGFLFYGALGQSDFFQIADIEIKGCQRLDKKEILELSGVDVHSNLVKINSAEMKELLEGHNWIERAEISRDWPDRLTISITERNPVAIINLDGGLHYIDLAANVFAPVAKMADLDYPVITGLTEEYQQGETGHSVLKEALLLIKYANRDNPNLPAQNISEINIANNDLVLFLVDRPFPVRLGRGDVWGKYERLVKVLYWLYKRKEFSRVSYVYVDYSTDKVLVGMETG